MMSRASKRELLAAIRSRYELSSRTARGQILDELAAATGYHRKHAIQVLNHPPCAAVRRRQLWGEPRFPHPP